MDIVAIGGGELGMGETLPIDRHIVELTGKKKPCALFIPTASGDSVEYCEAFDAIYGERLGCLTDHLMVHRFDPPKQEIKRKIDWADLIYVGGGNTKAMIARWKELGIDVMLREAGEWGTVLCGLSAGALCWFQIGCSDWPVFEGREDIKTAPVDCLGLVGCACCPHTTREEHRMDDFREMMKTVPLVGLGLDDLCAIHISGNSYKVLSADGEAGMHRVVWKEGFCEESFFGVSDGVLAELIRV